MVAAVILAAGAEAVLAAEVVPVAEDGVEAVPASNSHHLLPLTSYFLPLTSYF